MRRSASTRCRGGGVPGSLLRQARSSSVPMEKLMPTEVRFAASASRSRSRRIIVDLVRIENGLRASESTSISPRVSR